LLFHFSQFTLHDQSSKAQPEKIQKHKRDIFAGHADTVTIDEDALTIHEWKKTRFNVPQLS
jgi:hypothetical protein